MRRFVAFWGMLAGVLLLIGCDQGTKHLATERLRGQAPVEVVHDIVQLQYVENRGTAFSLIRTLPETARTPLIMFGGAAALALIGYMWHRRRDAGLAECMGLSLVVGGAVGNLWDRAAHGYVVDFVHVRYWPVFNAADAWLVAGVALLLLANGRRARAPTSLESGPKP